MKSFMMPFIPETTYLRRKKTRFGRPGLFSVPGTAGGRALEQGAACIDSQCNFSTIDAAVNIRQPQPTTGSGKIFPRYYLFNSRQRIFACVTCIKDRLSDENNAVHRALIRRSIALNREKSAHQGRLFRTNKLTVGQELHFQ